MDRTVVVGVVRMCRGSDLERTRGQRRRVGHASVDCSVCQTSTPSGEIDVIVVGQPVLVELRGRDIREWRSGISPRKHRRQYRVGNVVGWIQLKALGAGVSGGRLAGQEEVGAWCPVWVDDAFGKQIRNALAMTWLVGCEDVVEGAVFTNDHNYVLNGSAGLLSCCGKWGAEVSDNCEQAGGYDEMLPGFRQQIRFKHIFSS